VAGHDGGMISIRLRDGTIIKAPAGTDGQGSVRLGVRPEKLRVTTGGGTTDGGADVNALEGTVLDASYIGVSTQYLVETRDGHKMTAYTQNLETAGLADLLARGAEVRLTWQPRHTFVVAGPADHVAGDPHAPEEEEGVTDV
jgi:spermidine/putrescine transport system ATP-binding protein